MTEKPLPAIYYWVVVTRLGHLQTSYKTDMVALYNSEASAKRFRRDGTVIRVMLEPD